MVVFTAPPLPTNHSLISTLRRGSDPETPDLISRVRKSFIQFLVRDFTAELASFRLAGEIWSMKRAALIGINSSS